MIKMFYCLWNSNWKHCITHKRFKVQNRPHPNQHFEIHVVLYDQININWTTLSQKFGVASWHSNSGPNQENHKIRIMHVPTLLSQAHKTWPIKCCSQNVIKRKLWRPALCCENLMSYIINSLMLWQPCAARIKNLMSLETALCCGSLVMQKRKDLLSFSNGPCFTVIVMLRIESASAFSTTQQQHNSLAKECVTRQKAKRGPAITRGSIIINQGERRSRTIRKQNYAAILQMSHLMLSFYTCWQHQLTK